ncbi:MAG: hypothetical protein C4326_01585 [Ignavibacteria bacterium]
MNNDSKNNLHRREAQLRATLYSIGDAVIATDRKGRVEMLNPIAERLTGWKESDAVGKPLAQIFHIVNEKTRQPLEHPVESILREGVVVGLENHTLLISREGTECAIAGTVAPIFDLPRKITGVVVVFRDQSAERAAQRAVEEARQFAESIVEAVREPLLILDAQLEVVAANRSFYTLFRSHPHDTIGRKVYDLGNGQWNIPALRRLLEDILPLNTHFDHYVVEHEFEQIGKRTMVLNARRLLRADSRSGLILLAIEDITERTQAEDLLRASQERYRHICELVSDYAYAFRVEEDGTMLGEWVTKSFTTTFGYTLEEVCAPGGWRLLVHPDDVPIVLDHVRRVLRGERDICEMRLLTRTGEARWLRDYAIPVWDKERRRVVRVYGASQDITDRRRTLIALQASEERYRYISELISDYAYSFRVDANNTLVSEWVTESFTDITGYRPTEIDPPGAWQKLIHSDDQSIAHACFQRLLEGNDVVSVLRIVRKDGKMRYVRVHAHPVWDSTLKRVVRIYGAAQDITEQKLAEEELRASHQAYAQLIDSIDGIVWEADASTLQFVFVSKQAERVLGYPLERWTSEPTFWKDHIHPDDAGWAVGYCIEATAAMRPHEFEYRMIAADGRVVWLRDIVSVVQEDGRPIKLRGIMVDVTERKNTEGCLANYTRVLELVATGAPIETTLDALTRHIEEQSEGMLASILVLDSDGKRLRHGAAPHLPDEYNRMVDGLTIGEGVGSCGTAAWRRQQVIVSDIATDPLWASYRTVVKCFGLCACWSTPILDHDGSLLGTFALYYREPASPTARHLEVIQRATHLATIVLSKHKQERTLRESEERYRTLYQENPSMFFTLNAAGEVVSVNSFGAHYLGYEREELLGKPVTEVFHPDDREGICTHLAECIEQPDKAFRWQARKVRKNGEVIWVEECARAFPNPEGGTNVLVVCTDISERKEAEERRLQMEQRLQQAQKLESLGTLASGIAHDFNNILGIMLGHSSALVDLIGDVPKGRNHLEAITKAGERGAALVHQLLTFARKTDSIFEPLDVNEIILEVAKLLKETFPKTITLVTDLQPDLPPVVADATQLHQVVLNLSVNARDAMPKGGTLTMRTRSAQTVEVLARHPQAPERSYIVVEISDTGTGMDETTRRRIFEPFFTTKGVGKGTGLGLALVHGIVEAHNGFIEVESALHQGTTFRIALPAMEGDSREAPRMPSQAEQIVGGTEKLLIIEDEEMLRDLVTVLLEEKGYTILAAEDGKRGVELYEEHRDTIAAVITDMGLPIMSGEEVFHRIRAVNPQAKIILASGFVEPDVKADLMGRGVGGFIQKPYTVNEIVRVVREVLDTR